MLRREIYLPRRGRAWTREHRAWLAGLRFADTASEATFFRFSSADAGGLERVQPPASRTYQLRLEHPPPLGVQERTLPADV